MSKRIKVFWGIWFTALVFFSLSTFSFSEDSTPTAPSVVYIQKPVVLSTASDGMLTSVKGNTFCFEEGATEFATMRPGQICLLYTSPSPRDGLLSRMPSSA